MLLAAVNSTATVVGLAVGEGLRWSADDDVDMSVGGDQPRMYVHVCNGIIQLLSSIYYFLLATIVTGA